MARETAQQRRAREIAEAAQREAERASYIKGNPQRLVEMRSKLRSLNIDFTLDLDALGQPSITIHHNNPDEYVSDERITWDSEEWQIKSVFSQLETIEQDRAARVQRYQLAKDTYNSLTPAQQAALKEFKNSIF